MKFILYCGCGWKWVKQSSSTSIAETTGSNPVEALILFRLFPSNFLKLENLLRWSLFTFYKESATTPLRVMFDGSMKSTSGVSLNDQLSIFKESCPFLHVIIMPSPIALLSLIGSMEAANASRRLKQTELEKWSDIWNVSYIELRIWNQVSYDHRSNERNLSNCA